MEDKTAVLAAAQELAQAEDAIHGRRPREYFNSMLSHLDHQLSHRQNSFDKIQGEISRLSKAVALLATSVGRPENPSSSACLEQVGSCTSSLPAASCESTYWQPDYQRSSTSDSHAMPVFDGMPRPSYGMDSGIARELQGNKANSQANCQLLDTSSRSQYETSAMTWTYCPTLPGRVLSVNMHQVYHPVPIDVLSHLFSLYGVVETIFQSLNQHGRKVLIQYKHGYMADNALRATHGWYLYHTYCQLDIRHADSAELQILDDYSCALFSEINDADRLSHDVADIPQDEENYSSQNVTPHMEGHASEQQVQTNIPVSKVVTKCTHEQKQCDGKHDASTMPNERVIEQSTPIQALEELLSIYDPKMAVQLCKSDLVQAATRERQGNLASSTPLVLHVDDLQVPTTMQDASSIFKEMPVYDIYEEDNSCLHSMDEQLATPFHKASENALSEQLLKCFSKEPETEQTSACLNIVTDVLDVTLELQQEDDEKISVILEQREVWDPGASASFHSSKGSAVIILQQLHNMNISSMQEFSLANGRKVQWDPGIMFILYELWRLGKGAEYALRHLLVVKFGTSSYTYLIDTAAIMCDPPANLIQQRRPIAALLHVWPYKLLSSLVCTWDPGITLSSCRYSWLESGTAWHKAAPALVWSTSPCFADLQYHLPMINTYSVWDPGIVNQLDIWTERSELVNPLSCTNIPELLIWQSQVISASYVWDPGTVLFWYRSIWLLLFIEENDTGRQIPEQWSCWCNAYCKIFQRCTAMSSLFHCCGIPLWLINFQVP